MADCEQCAALQRQNDFLANDRDGYVQVLTDENNKLRAEVEKLREWNREIALNAREFVAENEKLRAALRQIAGIDVWDNSEQGYVDKARAALEGRT